MIVKVTGKHIKKGKSSTQRCPVALALKDAGVKDPSVSYGGIFCYGANDQNVFVHPPRSVQRFIVAFDHKKKVKPFSFIFKGA